MLPSALQSGISVLDYWELTYGEIKATIDAQVAKNNYHLKEQASLHHTLANLIGLSVSRLMDKEAEYPSLQESYPNLFTITKKVTSTATNQPMQDWEVAKIRIMQYAEANNKKER